MSESDREMLKQYGIVGLAMGVAVAVGAVIWKLTNESNWGASFIASFLVLCALIACCTLVYMAILEIRDQRSSSQECTNSCH